uniref:protein-tyrosine-phosphatase n=1 Tax=Magallana gigas TaxID=29159 RepID=K1QPY1_MAGGI
MRQNRISMIQTYEQYITVYLALNESFKAPIKADTMTEFLNKAEKARKNIPSFTNLQHFIVTRYPLEKNALNLLRLLSDHESDTVISMQPLSDIKSAEIRTVMVVEPELEIQCSGSSVDTSQHRSLVSTVLHLKTKQPITILSSDGASLCGLFIAVHNVIQQMNMDDRVDVFTAVRQLQIRRPELCARFATQNIYYTLPSTGKPHIRYTLEKMKSGELITMQNDIFKDVMDNMKKIVCTYVLQIVREESVTLTEQHNVGNKSGRDLNDMMASLFLVLICLFVQCYAKVEI